MVMLKTTHCLLCYIVALPKTVLLAVYVIMYLSLVMGKCFRTQIREASNQPAQPCHKIAHTVTKDYLGKEKKML